MRAGQGLCRVVMQQQQLDHAETEARLGPLKTWPIYHQLRTWNCKRRCRLMYHHYINIIGRSGIQVHREVMLLMLQKR